MRDQSGHIVQWYGLAHDIDDQIRAEHALRGLAATAIALNSCRSLDEVLRTITDRAREVIKAHMAFIGAHMAVKGTTVDQRWTQAIHAVSLSDKYAAYRDFDAKPNGSGIYAVVCDLNRPMRLTEAQLEAHPAWRGYGNYADQHPRLRGWLAVPLIDSNGQNMGVLQLSDKDQGDFTAEDEGIAVQLAQMASLAIAESRLHEKLRLAQETLARASQAASLSELSASIAHEVNQPLAAVVANSHACQRWLTAESPNLERAKKTVERIIRDANAAADVVSRIRALFKQSVEKRASMTLDSVIAEALNLMAEEAARRRIRVNVDVESNLPFLALDRVQIQQVVVNLIRNAMEAMVSATGDKVVELRTRGIGDVVQTEISDRGGGVESPDKIFEPFFTTKGGGMGMGLAICRSIVEAHGGRLWAEKNEPHGAKLVFTLPVEMKRAL
jgi:signal transduction histidine kinase